MFGLSVKIGGANPPGLNPIDFIGFMRELKLPPPSVLRFFAACEAMPFLACYKVQKRSPYRNQARSRRAGQIECAAGTISNASY
jgi:hypothetical protein